MSVSETIYNQNSDIWNISDIRDTSEAPELENVTQIEYDDPIVDMIEQVAREHELSWFNPRGSHTEYLVYDHEEINEDRDWSVYIIGEEVFGETYRQVVVHSGFMEVYRSGASNNPYTIKRAFKKALDTVENELEYRKEARRKAEEIEDISGVKEVDIETYDYTAKAKAEISKDSIESVVEEVESCVNYLIEISKEDYIEVRVEL